MILLGIQKLDQREESNSKEGKNEADVTEDSTEIWPLMWRKGKSMTQREDGNLTN